CRGARSGRSGRFAERHQPRSRAGCVLPSGAAAANGWSRTVTDSSGRFSSGIREALSVANRRVLVIDDSEAIHRDFCKVLGGAESVEGQDVLDVLESELFGARQDAQT